LKQFIIEKAIDITLLKQKLSKIRSVTMKVLGINGAPNLGGTIDQMMATFMGNVTGDSKETVALRDLNINPCRGCLKCVQSNRCILQDDWNVLRDKLMEAEVLVLGAPTYFSDALGINGLTHLFLERWFALRHIGIKLKLKKVVILLASSSGMTDHAVIGLKKFFEVYYMIPETEFVLAEGTMPCIICGEGETCPTSGFVVFFGGTKRITPELLPSLTKQPEVISKLKEIALTIK
jgi:multimeric flavodoxin WrbA